MGIFSFLNPETSVNNPGTIKDQLTTALSSTSNNAQYPGMFDGLEIGGVSPLDSVSPAGSLTGMGKWWGDNGGWVTGGLGLVQGLGNFYMGDKQLDLMKDQIGLQEQQLADQTQLVNTDIKDKAWKQHRANPEVFSDPNGYYEENKI